MLSKWSNYSAYLIFKLSDTAMGFSYPLQEGSVIVGAHVSKLSVRLMEEQYSRRLRRFSHRPSYMWNFLRRANEPPEDLPEPLNDQPVTLQEDVQAQDQTQREHEMIGKPQIREDGWMEILLGEFYNEEGDDGEVDMSLLEIKGGNWKSGLIVQGIEIRPKK